jgi:hypothetical protein
VLRGAFNPLRSSASLMADSLTAPNEVVLSAGQSPAFEEILEEVEFSWMTRAESRAQRGMADEPRANPESAQSNSPPAPVGDSDYPRESSDREHSPRDYDRPAATQSDEPKRSGPRGYQGPTFTGEAAMREATILSS